MIKQQTFQLIDNLKALARSTANWAKGNLPWRNVLWPSPLRAQESAPPSNWTRI